MNFNTQSIFAIKTSEEFQRLALDIFKFQATSNAVYNRYLSTLKVNIEKINNISQIPFLPIEFYKSHKIVTSGSLDLIKEPILSDSMLFKSSGTTGGDQSNHFVKDISIYETSFRKSFQLFYGDVKEYCVLALLPSYIERGDSSLVYMVNDLIKNSLHPLSGFYLNNYNDLLATLQKLKTSNQKTLLLGVSYALLDLAELNNKNEKIAFENLIIMETGGMKGKRQEMVKEELHKILTKSFDTPVIHSEYGMTELLSQSYSKGNGIFMSPPWMKILIRDINDPFTLLPYMKTGGVNIVDLANIYSCSFISTQDLGKLRDENSFEIIGRFDNSDIRGCNLLVE